MHQFVPAIDPHHFLDGGFILSFTRSHQLVVVQEMLRAAELHLSYSTCHPLSMLVILRHICPQRDRSARVVSRGIHPVEAVQ